ncbi:TIGR03032 family protein [Novosphingobium sp. P6W]|nr:TIGR03032 family protein [Novosphingobium sp. P6W]
MSDMTLPNPDETIVPTVRTSVSPGLPGWLLANAASFAFTSYQTGQLFLIGVMPDGSISLNQQNYAQAMGLSAQGGRLYLASKFQIWRLENMLQPGEVGNGSFDAVFVPRNAQTTGDLDVHELGVDRDGRVVFVNTSFSCLATLDLTHSFRSVWKPPFVTALAPGDRCHLNGLAIADGAPAYVTSVARCDTPGGWRQHRSDGGVLIDVRTDTVVAEGFSMPHSPRVVGDKVLLLDSGHGLLVEIDPATAARREIAFLTGFMRGLAIHGDHALITLSKPRNGTFAGLPLEQALDQRGCEAWCGVAIVNLSSGAIVEWLRLEGDITELFDVVALPGIRRPMSLGVGSPELMDTITFRA